MSEGGGEFLIEGARLRYNTALACRFRLVARGELLSFEKIAGDGQSGTLIPHFQFAHVLDLLFGEPQGVLVMREAVAAVFEFFPAAGDVPRIESSKRAENGPAKAVEKNRRQEEKRGGDELIHGPCLPLLPRYTI